MCSVSAYSAADDPLSIKNGLILRVDAGLSASYPGTGTTMCDLSGNGNHMHWSAAAAPLYTTFNGYGVLRTTPVIATLSAISTGTYNNLPMGSQPYSIVVMFKPNSLAPTRVLVTSPLTGKLNHLMGINENTRYAGGSSGLGSTWTSSEGVVPSTSHYVVMVTTFDGTTEKVYIDGVLDKTVTMTPAIPVNGVLGKSASKALSPPVTSSNRVVIGCSLDSVENISVENISVKNTFSETMDADVAVVMMYNRALTASEVVQIYGTYAKRFSVSRTNVSVLGIAYS